jgi:hypothetical protein
MLHAVVKAGPQPTPESFPQGVAQLRHAQEERTVAPALRARHTKRLRPKWPFSVCFLCRLLVLNHP